jgi:hypothetical protein
MGHIKTCKYVLQPCKLGCGLGVLGKDMKFHCDKQCANNFKKCKTCKEKIYVNRNCAHDCNIPLTKQLKDSRDSEAALKRNLENTRDSEAIMNRNLQEI